MNVDFNLLWFVFLFIYKLVVISSVDKNYCKKQKINIILVVVKKKLTSKIIKNKVVLEGNTKK